MKKKIETLLIVLIVMLASAAKMVDQTSAQTAKTICKQTVDQTSAQVGEDACTPDDSETAKLQKIKYVSLDVPNINNSFKTWMSYKAVTNSKSPQYKFIRAYGWADEEGFMRCYAEKELGIEQDYYMIALGSYYGTEIGTKYRITLDTGRVFYGVLADCKADRHTNSTNQYIPHNGNVVEFLVEKTKLNKSVRKTGDASAHDPLKGNIVKIEKIIL